MDDAIPFGKVERFVSMSLRSGRIASMANSILGHQLCVHEGDISAFAIASKCG